MRLLYHSHWIFLLGTFPLKLVGTGLQFLIALFLARLLGAEGYGIYAFTLVVVQLLSIAATLGQERVIARDLSGAIATNSLGACRQIWERGTCKVFLAGVILIALTYSLIPYLPILSSKQSDALLTALSLLLLLPLLTISKAAFQGLSKPVRAQLYESLLAPGLFLIGLIGLASGADISPGIALILWSASIAIAVFVSRNEIARAIPHPSQSAGQPLGCFPSNTVALVTIAFMSLAANRADLFMLSLLGDSHDAGPYAAAAKISDAIGIILTSCSLALIPRMATLHAQNRLIELQGEIRAVVRASFAITLCAATVASIFSKQLLGLFGADFEQAAPYLILLAIGNCINTAAGPIGYLFLMTRHENKMSLFLTATAAFSFLLNSSLILCFGPIGAAISTVVIVLTWNLGLSIIAYRSLGIRADIFSPTQR